MTDSNSKSKVNQADIQRKIAETINDPFGSEFHEPFPEQFFTISPENNTKQILYIKDDNTCAFCDIQKVVDAIVLFTQKIHKIDPDFNLNIRQCNEAARYWLSVSPNKPIPKSIAFKSDKGLSFHRLDFDLPKYDWSIEFASKKNDNQYAFLEFIHRCGNWRALAAFVGSLFINESDRENYVYLHGDGQNGKSCFVRLLHKCLGPTFHADDPNAAHNNRFWSSAFKDKRLVVFPDCNTPKFSMSGQFKMLTGGDLIRVEEKHKGVFTIAINTKFMFLSNKQLEISGSKADTRRAIYCEVAPIGIDPIPTNIYDKKLWSEREFFVDFCVYAYHMQCPQHGQIPIDKDSLDEIISNHNEWCEYFAEEHFLIAGPTELAKDEKRPNGQKIYKLVPYDLQRIFKESSVSHEYQTRFREWLRSKGIVKKPSYDAGINVYRYFGLCLKEAYDSKRGNNDNRNDSQNDRDRNRQTGW